MKVNLTKFRLGPRFKFNSGHPLAIRGTNLLTRFDEHNQCVYTALPDDNWKIIEDQTDDVDHLANELAQKIKNRKCTTCSEPYSQPPTFRASVCSNAFHCCRNCTWLAGRRIARCKLHDK